MGKRFFDQIEFLESNFMVLGYSDKRMHDMNRYIPPEKIMDYDFDLVYVTSTIYFEEIKNELAEKYYIPKEKIASLMELMGISEGTEARKKWVIEQLKQIPAGKTLLDAGAGEMQFKPYCSHLRYISQDFGKYNPSDEPGGIAGGKQVWDTSGCDIISDIIDIPLENNSVDVILCSEVFEHLQNPVLAVKEFSRLLKPGGMLILTAPFCSLTHMAPYYYYSGFSEYWYQTVLQDYGFNVDVIQKNGDLFMYYAWWLFRLDSLAKQYSDRGLTQSELVSVNSVITTLLDLSERDEKSAESLCFGHNVIAYKR